MPISEEKKRALFETAVGLSEHGMFCKCCALIWTRRQLSDWLGSSFPNPDSFFITDDQHNAKESVIEALISYCDSPPFDFNHLQRHAILGHALIIRALGSDAAVRIAHAYLAKGKKTNELCAALLLWVGENPELNEVVDKVSLPPGLAEALFFNARGALYYKAKVHVLDPNKMLWERLPSEILNQIPFIKTDNDDS
jgi:hypothetical protein